MFNFIFLSLFWSLLFCSNYRVITSFLLFRSFLCFLLGCITSSFCSFGYYLSSDIFSYGLILFLYLLFMLLTIGGVYNSSNFVFCFMLTNIFLLLFLMLTFISSLFMFYLFFESFFFLLFLL